MLTLTRHTVGHSWLVRSAVAAAGCHCVVLVSGWCSGAQVYDVWAFNLGPFPEAWTVITEPLSLELCCLVAYAWDAC